MEVFPETDEEAPDSWTHGHGTFECPYRSEIGDIECLMVYSQAMEFVAHMQTYHPSVDLDPS